MPLVEVLPEPGDDEQGVVNANPQTDHDADGRGEVGHRDHLRQQTGDHRAGRDTGEGHPHRQARGQHRPECDDQDDDGEAEAEGLRGRHRELGEGRPAQLDLQTFDVALTYATDRTQFGKPLVAFQMVQQKLVTMLAEVTAMQLYCLRLGRLIEEGRFTDTIAALAKLNNTVKARDVCRMAREILGGNGILLDYPVVRHMADMEALYTYEGTAEIQTLIVGRDITGVGAFT